MSVLAEAFSVIVSRAAIDRTYPGGVEAFRRDAPAGTFCTDGLLARAGFPTRASADFFAALLRASGLTQLVGGHAADFVLIDEQSGPLAPCLWLEHGRDRRGLRLCWHAVGRRGVLHVPEGWEPEADRLPGSALAQRPGGLPFLTH
jgi:hypothetical protein